LDRLHLATVQQCRGLKNSAINKYKYIQMRRINTGKGIFIFALPMASRTQYPFRTHSPFPSISSRSGALAKVGIKRPTASLHIIIIIVAIAFETGSRCCCCCSCVAVAVAAAVAVVPYSKASRSEARNVCECVAQ